MMDLTEQLNIPDLFVEEHHDYIIKNLERILDLYYFDITDIGSSIFRTIESCGIFNEQELKNIILKTVEYIEKRGDTSDLFLKLHGMDIKSYNKDDFKKIFYSIMYNRIMKKMRSRLYEVIKLRNKLIDPDFQEKQIREEILEIYLKFIQEEKMEADYEQMLNLISIQSDEGKIEDLFVTDAMKRREKTIDNAIEKVVEKYFSDNMRFISAGGESFVFGSRDTIVKYSWKKTTYVSYNSDVLLEYSSTGRIEVDDIVLAIGQQKMADTKWYEHLSREQIILRMYDAFCRAMQDGYVIGDIKIDNFGIVAGSLKCIDLGYVYKRSEFEMEQMGKSTFEKSLIYFLKLYKEGYRINKDGNLEQNGVLRDDTTFSIDTGEM